MNKEKSSSILLVALTLLLSNLLLPVTAFSQNGDPNEGQSSQEVALADFPLEFHVLSQRSMINGSYQYVGWTLVIHGRVLGQTHRGDEILVALSQNGKLIHILFVELQGTRSRGWYEDFEIRGDDNDVLSSDGTITATFKYYHNRDERTTTLGVKQFEVMKPEGR